MAKRQHLLRYNVIDVSSVGGPTNAAGLLGLTIPDHETTNGWASKINCKYPQHLMVELTRPGSDLTEIRILAHQHWIPTNIHIYVSHHDEMVTSSGSNDDVHLLHLGTIKFKSLKEKNGDRLREQKIIKVNVKRCDRIKFQIENVHKEVVTNPDNKVGIIQLLLYGRPNKKAIHYTRYLGCGTSSLVTSIIIYNLK